MIARVDLGVARDRLRVALAEGRLVVEGVSRQLERCRRDGGRQTDSESGHPQDVAPARARTLGFARDLLGVEPRANLRGVVVPRGDRPVVERESEDLAEGVVGRAARLRTCRDRRQRLHVHDAARAGDRSFESVGDAPQVQRTFPGGAHQVDRRGARTVKVQQPHPLRILQQVVGGPLRTVETQLAIAPRPEVQQQIAVAWRPGQHLGAKSLVGDGLIGPRDERTDLGVGHLSVAVGVRRPAEARADLVTEDAGLEPGPFVALARHRAGEQVSDATRARGCLQLDEPAHGSAGATRPARQGQQVGVTGVDDDVSPVGARALHDARQQFGAAQACVLEGQIPTSLLDVAVAKRLNAEIEVQEARIRQGLDQPALVNGDETFGDLVEWWIAERLAQTRAYKRCAGTVRRHILASPLAKLAPAELTPGKVDNFLYSKADEVGPATVNHLRAYIRRAVNAARAAERFHGPNPVTREVRKRKVPKRKPLYLQPEWIPPILDGVPERWRGAFAVGIYGGLRKGEIVALKKRDVDLAAGLLYVRRSNDAETTKGGHEDGIPIADELRPYLERALETSPSDWVFPRPDGSQNPNNVDLVSILRTALRRAQIVTGYVHKCRRQGCGYSVEATDGELRRCARCNMKLWPVGKVVPIRFHDTRHTTASLLMMFGASPAAVQRILRHSDIRVTTDVYGHLAPGYLRSEIDRLSFRPKSNGFTSPVLQDLASPPSTPSDPSANLQSSQGVNLVGARGFEPPTSCSQNLRRKSQRVAMARNWWESFRISPLPILTDCSKKQRFAKILLLFCSRKNHCRWRQELVVMSACCPSQRSHAGWAYAARRSTSSVRAATSTTFVC